MRFASLCGLAVVGVIGCGSGFESGPASADTGTTTTTTTTGGGGGSATTPIGAGGGGSTGEGGGSTGAGGSTATSTGTGDHPQGPCAGVKDGVARDDGHCYVLLAGDGRTFGEAKAECEAIVAASGRKGHLVHVDDAAEEAWIEQGVVGSLAGTKDVWIGLVCPKDTVTSLCIMPGLGADEATFSSRWSWVDDGASCTYQDWTPPGPMFVAPPEDPNAAEDARCAALHGATANAPLSWEVRLCSKPGFVPPTDFGGEGDPWPMAALCEID